MNAFAQAWGAILPLRWYMAVLLGQAARGLPLARLRAPVRRAGGTGRALLAARAPSPALDRAEASTRSAPAREPAPPAAAPRGIGGAFAAEWRRVLGDPRRLHPAGAGAADLRHLLPAALSRPDPAQDPDRGRRQRPERAEPQHRADPGRERRGQRGGARRDARRSARRGRPRRGLRRGRHPARHRARRAQGHDRPHSDLRRCHLPVHLPTTANGIAVAINTLSSELAAGGARTDGSLVKATLASASPADILLQPIFNPVGGYASYIVPAAFVLILQQMLLIGAAMLTVVALAQAAGGAFANVLGRGIAHLTHLSARARALLHRAAARLRLFRARPPAAVVRARLGVRPRDQLHGPGGRAPGSSIRRRRRSSFSAPACRSSS